MEMRNIKHNRWGGADCEILVGHIPATAASDAIYSAPVLDAHGNLIEPAQLIVPAIEARAEVPGEWLPHTLEHIPEGVEIAPYTAPAVTKEHLIAAVAARRWEVETGGITIGGKKISTTRESQAMVTGAYHALNSGLMTVTNWKDDEGKWAQIDFNAMKVIATAVAQHVSTCFTIERNHQETIQLLATQSAIDTYDINQGWPVQV